QAHVGAWVFTVSASDHDHLEDTRSIEVSGLAVVDMRTGDVTGDCDAHLPSVGEPSPFRGRPPGIAPVYVASHHLRASGNIESVGGVVHEPGHVRLHRRFRYSR